LGDLVPSGIPGLDPVLGGGYRRGASFLLAGAPGTGKTTLASSIVQAACAQGDRALCIAFEESEAAIVANMLSPGIDLRPALQAETLRFQTALPESTGVEEHLFRALHALRTFQPHLVVVDALSSTLRMGMAQAAFEYAIRLLHACKECSLTCLFANQITEAGAEDVFAGVSVSSLADIVMVLRAVESDHTLRCTLLVRESRGAAASLQAHEFRITDRGIDVLGVASGARPSKGPARRPSARGRGGQAR
jgi:circadian clock protein KaiC